MTDLRDILDRVFSLYVRRRDCGGGQGRCITCGKAITWDKCDAGHYIPRAHLSTRWNEINVHAQCVACNRLHDGMEDKYREALIQRYGLSAVETLERRKHDIVKLTNKNYKELINYYKLKIKRL